MTVTLNELIGALRQGDATIVDVLSPESFAARHIPGAINIPLGRIRELAPVTLPDRGASVIVYCGGPT